LPAYPVAVVLLVASALLAGDPARLVMAGIGLVALLLFYAALAFGYRGGMGLGDVKLAGVLGLYLGYLGLGPLLVGALAPFLLGGLFALILVVLRRAGRKSRIPFGPWMLAGSWLGLLIGQVLFVKYLELVGLR
jgi:leader peptidase (prepilin peptidase) / N-methyltransferase